jgi:hypothetical protein
MILAITANESSGCWRTGILLSTVDGETRHISDWRALGQHFRISVTRAVALAKPVFCFGLPPVLFLPLRRQCISASNNLMNQVNCNWQEWRCQETRLLGIAPACTKLIKSLSRCPKLSEFQQIDFINRIDTPHMPPNDVRFVLIIRPNRPAPVDARQKKEQTQSYDSISTFAC